jgi:hypothetical protein
MPAHRSDRGAPKSAPFFLRSVEARVWGRRFARSTLGALRGGPGECEDRISLLESTHSAGERLEFDRAQRAQAVGETVQ